MSQQQVNDLYTDQPAGFAFGQSFTVETLLLTGSTAFGDGYDDPSGVGGNYAIGMLSSVQDDRLGLSFDVGQFAFFNFRFDFSSVGLDPRNGPFASPDIAPKFGLTLFDNPSGDQTIGSGTILDRATITGTRSAVDTLGWTTGVFAFDASRSTNGNVTLQFDLLEGGYAALDNFDIAASDTAGGGIPAVPLPAGLPLIAAAMASFGLLRRRKA